MGDTYGILDPDKALISALIGKLFHEWTGITLTLHPVRRPRQRCAHLLLSQIYEQLLFWRPKIYVATY